MQEDGENQVQEQPAQRRETHSRTTLDESDGFEALSLPSHLSSQHLVCNDATGKVEEVRTLQGYLALKKLPPPQDFRRALDIGLL